MYSITANQNGKLILQKNFSSPISILGILNSIKRRAIETKQPVYVVVDFGEVNIDCIVKPK